MATAIYNGVGWADATVSFSSTGGVPVPILGVTEISFGDMQDKGNGYGAGKLPIRRERGNVEFPEASMTLYLEDLEAMKVAAGGANARDFAPFTLTVTWFNGSILVSKKLSYVEFKGEPVSMKSGDKSIQLKCALVIGNIE